jgi:hypothetical protein
MLGSWCGKVGANKVQSRPVLFEDCLESLNRPFWRAGFAVQKINRRDGEHRPSFGLIQRFDILVSVDWAVRVNSGFLPLHFTLAPKGRHASPLMPLNLMTFRPRAAIQ